MPESVKSLLTRMTLTAIEERRKENEASHKAVADTVQSTFHRACMVAAKRRQFKAQLDTYVQFDSAKSNEVKIARTMIADTKARDDFSDALTRKLNELGLDNLKISWQAIHYHTGNVINNPGDWETGFGTPIMNFIGKIKVSVSASWPRTLETPNQVEEEVADEDKTAAPAVAPEMKVCIGVPVAKKECVEEADDVSDAESTASSWVQDA